MFAGDPGDSFNNLDDPHTIQGYGSTVERMIID